MMTSLIAKSSICRNTVISLHNFDVLLFLGAFLMLFQTVLIVYAVEMGLGKHLSVVLGNEDRIRKVGTPYAPTFLICLKY